MTETEANQACEQFKKVHADRDTHTWIPSDGGDGNWSVLKVALPASGMGEIKATVGVKNSAELADDPRTALRRNVGPNH